MLETLEYPVSEQSAASRAAARNWAANASALRVTQPGLLSNTESLSGDVEWVFARDGSLSSLDANVRWWKGCSLPNRAAEFMLRKADLSGNVLCFLYPTHAAQLRRALDRMTAGQAILALTPDWETLRMILACDDFSVEITAHRVYFAAGEKWELQLDQLLTELPGLPTPTQFIRPILADSSPADELISPAQKVFADHSNRRAQMVRKLRENWTSRAISRICVVAPANFRLWDNAGHALLSAMSDLPDNISISRFNPDDPASASSAALAVAAVKCDGIVMPNLGRADLPDLLPDAMPVVTWLTSPRIPSAEKAGPNDTLLVADAGWKSLAAEQGWESARIVAASWPPIAREVEIPGVFRIAPKPMLAIISDTQPLDPPVRVVEYSSHRLLWEAIREELLNDPFALSSSPDSYLSKRMRDARIEDEGFDRAVFLDGVILHAFQQGLARVLVRERLPLKLFGIGWEDLDEFRDMAGGPVRSQEQFDEAVSEAIALVHAWPKPGAHPIDASGKPVIRPGARRESFIRDAKMGLDGKLTPATRPQNVLTGEAILRALCIG